MNEKWKRAILKALLAASIPIGLVLLDDLVDDGKLDAATAQWVRRAIEVGRRFI
jgi:hypothetical protein